MGFERMYGGNKPEGGRNENDFYPTPPFAVKALLGALNMDDLPWWNSASVWEPACGKGYVAEELRRHGLRVRASDLYEYPVKPEDVGKYEFGVDFLKAPVEDFSRTSFIITNPPYAKNAAEAFARKAIEHRVTCALLCRSMFMESGRRLKLFREHPPRAVYQFSGRFSCDEPRLLTDPLGGMVSYAWFVWSPNHRGPTALKWLDTKEEFLRWKESIGTGS